MYRKNKCFGTRDFDSFGIMKPDLTYKTNKHQLIDLMAGVIIRMCSINEIYNYTPKHLIFI